MSIICKIMHYWFEKKTLCKSLIYTRNNTGTRVNPCGAPYKTSFTSQEYPHICTYYLFVRKDRKQLLACPRAPQCSSFARRMSCLTVSIAFCRSMKTPNTKWSLSKYYFLSFKRQTSTWLIEWLFRKPKCHLKSKWYFVKNEYKREYIYFPNDLLRNYYTTTGR